MKDTFILSDKIAVLISSCFLRHLEIIKLCLLYLHVTSCLIIVWALTTTLHETLFFYALQIYHCRNLLTFSESQLILFILSITS
jgi:hypothetical protein